MKIISVVTQHITSHFIRYMVSIEFNKILVGFKILKEVSLFEVQVLHSIFV